MAKKKSLLHRLVAPIGHPIKQYFVDRRAEVMQRKDFAQFVCFLQRTKGKKRIFYLGVTAHCNLGDLAQHYCICRWLDKYCNDYEIGKSESDTVVNPRLGFVEMLKRNYTPDDVILFQSGYTTQDLGGNHELMHRLIADNIPDAKVLMMPQTIFFKEEKNRARTAQSYNGCRNMLFLARDMISYGQAKQMFPNLKVLAYPDIVTSLIGSFDYDNQRDKIFLCRRDDGEKFYPETDLIKLREQLQLIAPVVMGDTQSKASIQNIRANLQQYIENEIEKYSTFKVTITDRYHGTIFSLCAGTPVVIIKSNDHKVVTGADWFKGGYDGYVYVAEDLDDAYHIAEEICNDMSLSHKMSPYFEQNYYGQALRKLFDQTFLATHNS